MNRFNKHGQFNATYNPDNIRIRINVVQNEPNINYGKF